MSRTCCGCHLDLGVVLDAADLDEHRGRRAILEELAGVVLKRLAWGPHLPSRILRPLHELFDLGDQVVVLRVAHTEQPVLGLGLVHPLDYTVQIDPLVEALTHAHDRIKESGVLATPGDDIDGDRADGHPKGEQVYRAVEQQLDLEDREISERSVPRGDRKWLLMRHVYKASCLRAL